MTDNIRNGVAKIYKGEILGLIASVLLFITAIAAAVAAAGFLTGSDDALVGGGLFAGLFGLVGAILVLVGAIISLIGTYKASKDNENFKNALLWIVISVCASIIASIVGNNLVGKIIEAGSSVANIATVVYIIKGCVDVCPSLADEAEAVKKLIIAALILDAVATILTTVPVVGVVAAIVSLVCSLVYYFKYLGLLKKVKNM